LVELKFELYSGVLEYSHWYLSSLRIIRKGCQVWLSRERSREG